jgi:hypothetical protein
VTFFASLALVVVLVIRPQEIWPALEALRLLDVCTGLVVLGLLVELALGKHKYLYSPQLPLVGAFVAVGYFVTALALGTSRGLTLATNDVAIPAVFMVAIVYGSSTLPRLRTMIWTLLLLAGFVAAVAVHQGSVSPVCIEQTADESGALEPDLDKVDGRVCGLPSDCRQEGDNGAEWACEKLGFFKTISIHRRVRWRGQLDDPNELSVFLGGAIPLLFAVGLPLRNAASRRGPGLQKVLAVASAAMVVLALYAVILTQSRGGQLVVLTVLVFMFVSRFGWKGVGVAVLAALPVLLLGGREDAEDSSTERIELLTEGVSLVIAHPFRGVGVEQFADQVNSPAHLTAHNSYLLALAETGFPGFFCWSGIVWTSLKIPITTIRKTTLSPEIRTIATSLLVSFTGIAVGIFFLSFTYKQLLFVWFGLAGALYIIVREADPTVRVRFGFKDAAGVALADLGVISLLYVYTRARGGP